MLTHLYCMIGYPLSHSFSRRYFVKNSVREGIEGCRYELFPLKTSNNSLPCWPHPTCASALSFLQTTGRRYIWMNWRRRGLEVNVNTIKVNGGRLAGSFGMFSASEQSLQFLETAGALPGSIRRALILGTGEGVKVVQYVFAKNGVVSAWYPAIKPGQLTYLELNETWCRIARLIVNTTPLGMSPNETCPEIPFNTSYPAPAVRFGLQPRGDEICTMGFNRERRCRNGLRC